MQKFKPVSNAQYFLLPPPAEDFIREDHLARVISEVADSLDTSAIEKKDSYPGQKSYAPKLLLKILFYGYATGMRSGTKMAAACESDVAFMYLSSMYRPDFRTLNDFRKNNITRVEQFFVGVIRLCAAMNMVNISTLAIDSTRIKASASLRRTHTKQQYQQWLPQIEERVKDVTAEADLTDQQEDAGCGKDKRGDELPKEINTREKLSRKIKEVPEEMKDEKEDSCLTTHYIIIKYINSKAGCTRAHNVRDAMSKPGVQKAKPGRYMLKRGCRCDSTSGSFWTALSVKSFTS